MNKTIPIVALALAAPALVLAVHAELRVETRAQQAVREREAELIDAMWPTLKELYTGMDLDPEKYPKQKPQKIEEMFRPLFLTFDDFETRSPTTTSGGRSEPRR